MLDERPAEGDEAMSMVGRPVHTMSSKWKRSSGGDDAMTLVGRPLYPAARTDGDDLMSMVGRPLHVSGNRWNISTGPTSEPVPISQALISTPLFTGSRRSKHKAEQAAR